MKASTFKIPAALVCCVATASATDLFSRSGVTVINHDLEARVVPEVQRPDRRVTMDDVARRDEATCADTVDRALLVYPEAFVGVVVKRLALAGDIHVWDRRVGGVQAAGLLAINCIEAATNMDHETDSVHDAIAAKVLALAPPDWSQWELGNPPRFRYGDLESYKSALSDPDSGVVEGRLNRDGFVSRFGLVGRENDFESYAEQVFGHGPEFAAIVRAHPAMRGKLRLLMQSYIRVAPDLADRFKASGLDQMAALP